MISQEQLINVVMSRDKLSNLKREIKLKEAHLLDDEEEVISRLKKGELVEEGNLTPIIQAELKRAVVSWKEVVLELKGAAFVEERLAKAERVSVDKLVISHG